MSKSDQEPFVFTNEIVQELLANDWQLGVLSGGGPEGLSFDELRAGGWTHKQIHRVRSMDFVPGDSDPNRRHRFVLHAWDGFLDHMIESRREHGWKNEYMNTLAALATSPDWIGHTTINPGAYNTGGTHHTRPTRLPFVKYSLDSIESMMRDALINTRADELRDFDF